MCHANYLVATHVYLDELQAMLCHDHATRLLVLTIVMMSYKTMGAGPLCLSWWQMESSSNDSV